jgi:hypothetical protein
MDILEFENRIDTVYSICYEAIMFRERYREILMDNNLTKIIFPNIKSENFGINFSIDDVGIVHRTSKKEVINEHNNDLYKAWLINFGILGMTSVLEYFLKMTVEKITGKKYKGMGILYKFKELTNIDLKEFPDFSKINQYYQVRHISMHNYSKMDEKFLVKTNLKFKLDSSYVFFPIDLKHYKCLLILFAEFILEKSKI